MAEADQCYGVYRVLKSGKKRFVSRTVTPNQKLAEQIAQGFTDGEVTIPDGSRRRVTPHPHIAQLIKPGASPESQ